MIYPNEPHLFAADKTNPYTVYHAHIDCAGSIPQIFQQRVKASMLDKSVPAKFEHLARLTHHSVSPTRETRIMAEMFLILAELFDFARIKNTGKVKIQFVTNNINRKFSDLLDHLQQAPFHYPGIESLAQSMHMSRRNFTRYFRRNTGMSVRGYYLAGMMTYARNLMELKEYTLKEIAWQCGYANSQNFLRAYRQYMQNNKS